MSLLLGLGLGTGLFLVWWSFWPRTPQDRVLVRDGRLRQLLAQAGVEQVGPAGVLAATVGCGVVALLTVFLLTRTLTIALCFSLFGALVPWVTLRWQARKRRTLLRDVWPDAVDHLRSAVRAGLTLPEALIQLGDKGPEELQPAFRDFARDYRSGLRFTDALDNLKFRMADPVADRLVAALRLTRDVGGADLGTLLSTLSEFLREDARTRSELESRQSWTVNAARLAVAAPWIVLLLLGTQPEAVRAYQSLTGLMVLAGGLVVSVVCYQLMLRIGSLPDEKRVL
ncbi:type II secretion system protein F [Citricoccus sp. SGAir0253]|uniref:type II secretion system F family protein n=1 Tax=Citricoccus sp. SGAir0253 TaxID=2567881 RepID=UPI0010CCEB9A|nr:type II secretion system F family protein [Citricoccus sp. SGAir0253]QCU78478.1 type II secretion system protein F [Citricoccus sp. SGAir0253]